MSPELSAAVWGALLGALTGGFVSYVVDNMRDAQHRRLLLSDQLKDLSFDFNAYVQTYWSSVGSDKIVEAKIVSGFNKLQAKLSQLGFDPIYDTDVRLLMKEILQFSTSGSFATRGHTPDLGRIKCVRVRIESLVSLAMRGPRTKKRAKKSEGDIAGM